MAEVEEALALRDDGVGDMCVGEVGGMRPEGFDFNNSPSQISGADLRGKDDHSIDPRGHRGYDRRRGC